MEALPTAAALIYRSFGIDGLRRWYMARTIDATREVCQSIKTMGQAAEDAAESINTIGATLQKLKECPHLH